MPLPPPRIRREDIRREIDRLEQTEQRFPAFRILTEQVPETLPERDRPLTHYFSL